jgi:hypothetical protein
MRRPRRNREKGAALIMVVVVIAALLVIAAPFLVSMRLNEKSSQNFASELRAKQLATAGRNNAVAKLLESHPDEERRARVLAGDTGSDPEGYDGLDEIQQAEEFSGGASGIASLNTGSATGTMLNVTVADSRSRLDINTCGAGPIANLLGVTVTTAVLDFDSTKGVTVEDTRDFFSDGDPTTVDGSIRIRGEEIHYRHLTPTSFLGLTRGANFSRMNRPDDTDARRTFHPEGSLVQDGRGLKVALDPLWRTVGTDREGELLRFTSPGGIRRIADWELATQQAALHLFGKGLNLKSLRSLGISKTQILDAGLRVEDFDKSNPDRSKETPEERRLRHKAEKALGTWGLSVKQLRKRGGDQGVVRLYKTLLTFKADERKKLVSVYRQRQEKRKNASVQLTAWQKKELKRNIVGLTEARNQAPHLETIGRIELEEKLRPFVTTDAPPEGASWSDPQVVNHVLLYNPEAQVTRLKIQDARRFRRGWVVRVHPLPRADGVELPDEFRFPSRPQKNQVVSLFPLLDADYQQSAVEVSCRQPRPINVNTASRVVLRAVLTGLRSNRGQRGGALGGRASNIVTPTQARAIASAITSREDPLRGPKDLRDLLLELRGKDEIDDHDVDAVYRNSLDAADPRLSVSSVPFCYRSGDVYEVRATGIVNDPSGLELARHTYEDVIQVAPPRELTWSIDSQLDMTDRLSVPGRPRRGFRDRGDFIFRPGRWQNLILTRPAPVGPYLPTPFFVPPASHAPGQGDMQPQSSRVPNLGTNGSSAAPTYPQSGGANGGPTVGPLKLERYDISMDGAALGSVNLGSGELGARWYQYDQGPAHQSLGPGSVRGWYRFDRLPGGGEKAFLFDGGKADAVDRVSLYLQDGDLVLALHDEALDERESTAQGGLPRAQELRHTPTQPWVEGNWYHVAAFWKGTEPGDMALAVDGRYVGGTPTIGSQLSTAIDGTESTLTVDDASLFPPQGFLRLGATRRINSPSRSDRGVGNTDRDSNALCEVLEYTRVQGNVIYLKTERVLPLGAALRRAPRKTRTQLSVPTPPVPRIGVDAFIRVPARGSGVPYRLDYQYVDSGGTTRRAATFPRLGYPHEVGTVVLPYGYHCRVSNTAATPNQPAFQDEIREGGASLQESLPAYTPTTVLYDIATAWVPSPTTPIPPILVAPGATQIPVLWAAAYPDMPVAIPDQRQQPTPPAQPLQPPPTNVVGGFPPRGIVRICSINVNSIPPTFNIELVYYDRIQLVGQQYWLMGCERGLGGTTDTSHTTLGSVVLESIQLTADPGGQYAPRPAITSPRSYVSLTQVDPSPSAQSGGTITEWLSVLELSPQDRGRVRGFYFYLPARDTYEVPEIGPPPSQRGFVPPDSQFTQYVINLVTQNGGVLPGDPGDWILNLPSMSTDPNFMHPLKEVMKRRGQNSSRAQKGTQRPLTPIPSPPPPVPAPVDTHLGHRGRAQAGANAVKVVPTWIMRLNEGAHRVQVGLTGQPTPGRPVYDRPGPEAGYGDVVTVTDDSAGDPVREEMRVAHSARSNSPQTDAQQIARGNVGGRSNGWLVAFDDFVSRLYEGSARARIAKWPVGNVSSIPDLVFGRARPPLGPNDVVNDAPGLLEGRLDDLVSMQLEESVLPPGVILSPSDTTLGPVQGKTGPWSKGFLYLGTAGEVMAVTGAQQTPGPNGQGGYINLELTRGALGTAATRLGPESTPWRLTWPPIAVARGPIGGSRAHQIPVHNRDRKHSPFRDGTDGGYLALDPGGGAPFAEIYPYEQRVRRQKQWYFERPVDRFDRGAFRSAFGSGTGTIGDGSLLFDLPFRVHDRYADRKSSLQGVFFQFSRELPASLITSVEWDELLPTPFTEVKVAVRLDGVPSWDAKPTATPGRAGRLYLFDDPQKPNQIFVRANRVEIRVYLTFKPQAFERDAWKRGAQVGRVQLKYRQPTRTIRREERSQ